METTALEGQAIRQTISRQCRDSESGGMQQWTFMTIVVNSFPLQPISAWLNLIKTKRLLNNDTLNNRTICFSFFTLAFVEVE